MRNNFFQALRLAVWTPGNVAGSPLYFAKVEVWQHCQRSKRTPVLPPRTPFVRFVCGCGVPESRTDGLFGEKTEVFIHNFSQTASSETRQSGLRNAGRGCLKILRQLLALEKSIKCQNIATNRPGKRRKTPVNTCSQVKLPASVAISKQDPAAILRAVFERMDWSVLQERYSPLGRIEDSAEGSYGTAGLRVYEEESQQSGN